MYTDEIKRPSAFYDVKKSIPNYDEPVLVINDDGRYAIAKIIRIKNSRYACDEWRIMYSPYDDDVWNYEEHGKIVGWSKLEVI